ncbi:MAG: co-chaperone GroES [Alphaproteobacteria bacterium]|jgi:co-chaperonin GroES (HSP10)|nr:co-chaperone GroES [Alphaproteobacteria bacterium]
MKIRALGRNVVVRVVEQDLTTQSGIVLTRASGPQRAKVLNVGTEVEELKEGDVVLLNWNAAHKIGDDLYKVHIDEVVGVIED